MTIYQRTALQTKIEHFLFICLFVFCKISEPTLKNITLKQLVRNFFLNDNWNFKWPCGSWVIDQMNIFACLINNFSLWPKGILMPFLCISDNLLQDDYIIFQKSVDKFEIMHKTCSILVCNTVPPSWKKSILDEIDIWKKKKKRKEKW